MCVDTVLAVIGGAFRCVAEDLVGGGDSSKAGGCSGIGTVAIWMVTEREGVELSILLAFFFSSLFLSACVCACTRVSWLEREEERGERFDVLFDLG